MKKHLRAFATVAVSLTLASAQAQMGGRPGMGPQGPQFTGAMAKVFGENTAFSANMEIQADMGGQAMTMPAKLSYNKGQTRMEMDLTAVKGGHLPPQALGQLKAMGMDSMVTINQPDKKMTYLVYPGLQAYCEMPLQNPDAAKAESDFKVATTELGKETVAGHDCVKNKVVVTDKDGASQEFTVWNATDLKNFPVKLEMTQRGVASTITFSDIKLGAPEASAFTPPSDFKKYDSMQAMMQQEMMKHMGNMQNMGHPPQQQ